MISSADQMNARSAQDESGKQRFIENAFELGSTPPPDDVGKGLGEEGGVQDL